MTTSIDVILIRHAQSTWNAESRFTGWANPPLTQAGKDEARKAAHILSQHDYRFDKAYTSVLTRAIQTADIILAETQQENVPVERDWRLNERHYGKLQGLNKIEIAAQVGKDQVHRWRRGYRDRPESLAENDQHHPRFDALYKDVDPAILPGAESLADTQQRALAFWREKAVNDIQNQRTILVSAHGNTLRGLIMSFSKMSETEVETFEIPTGIPIVYHFDKEAKPLSWDYLKN